MYQDPYRPPSLTSSPDQFSSDRHLSSPPPFSPIYSFPRIQLSPNSPAHEDDCHLSWDPPSDPKVAYSLPSFRSLFSSDDEHPSTSEYDASEYSEPDPTQDDSFLTESEDEEQDSFFSDTRVTFFHTSAERGRWKSEPRYALLRISARTTSPAPSPVPSAIQRNISEPAPSIKNSPDDEKSTQQASSPLLPTPVSPVPPVLSPISLAISPMAGSVSPLSAMEPLSPLSLPPSSLAGDHDMDLESFPDHEEIPTAPTESKTGLGLFDSLPAPPSPFPSITEPADPMEVISAVSTITSEGAGTAPDSAMEVDPQISKKSKASRTKSREPPLVPSESVPSSDTRTPHQETVSPTKQMETAAENEDLDKGKKRSSQQSLREEGPKSKKARISHTLAESSGSRSRTKRVEPKPNRKTKDVLPKGKKVARVDASKKPPPEQKSKQRKSRPRSPSPSASSSRSLSVPPEETAAPEIDPELCGMLIECLATSRASSLPMSTLYRTVMQSYPSLKSRGTERECLEIMERVLEGGTVAGGGTGVFGKVQQSNGKDDSDPPLEAQWFYVPERDQDQDRAQLIRSMMPRPAKRSETKKYKQYYYRPLEKISRWDPEDEL
ncbi:hypothetical protein B0H15DRAFT_942933 [Mycena belliarum]|uniref:Uncharacterized protein n=1 Tax=Mycena belliarum TaxID=1033014 RepID=A0AAD6UM31_9AGAR|nr:hypothetical protein B0H15DRAFT_942933 [Mycena belliae]